MTNEAFLKVGGTTDLLDTTTVTQDDGTVTHREAVILADPDDNRGRVNLKKRIPQFAGDDDRQMWALPVSDDQITKAVDTLESILIALRRIEFHLSIGSDEFFDNGELNDDGDS